MDEARSEPMLKRLDRLEVENRRWKIFGIFGVALIVFLLTGAAQVQKPKPVDEIRTKLLVLVNQEGEEVGHFAASEKGALLLLQSSNHKAGIALGATSDSPILSLTSDKGVVSADFFADTPIVSLTGPRDRDKRAKKVSLGLGQLTFTNQDGKDIWSAPASDSGPQTGRTWVLWVSVVDVHRAAGAWFSKAECEQEKTHMISIAKEPDFKGITLVCLPENVHPRGQR